MNHLKRYRHLSALLLIIALSALLAVLNIIRPSTAIWLVVLWQLSQLAITKPRAACYIVSALTPDQIEEFQQIMSELGGHAATLKELPNRLRRLETDNDELRGELRKLRKTSASLNGGTGIRWIGNKPFVTDDCANALAATLVIGLSGIDNGLERMIPDSSARSRILAYAKSIPGGIPGGRIKAGGVEGTADIPLPTVYVPQIIELVFAYGQARQFATVFPLGAGTVKLPRLQAGEDNFGYLGAGTAGMSQNVPQKEVTAQLVTFTANKFGGLIRIPFEIEEDTFIPIGQFLARYIARQFAKGEDNTLFNGDGTGTYANITGIGLYCVNNVAYLNQLAAGKTKPTDAQLSDFRVLRTKVNPAVIANMNATGQTEAAYYMHPSLESLLVSFNTIGSPLIYRPQNGNQPATLDGFPIRWLGVTQAYQTIPAASAYLAFFGDLSYWYLGERGAPRVEISREVFFATDELAMRALERIDVEAMAIDAMACLQLAAA